MPDNFSEVLLFLITLLGSAIAIAGFLGGKMSAAKQAGKSEGIVTTELEALKNEMKSLSRLIETHQGSLKENQESNNRILIDLGKISTTQAAHERRIEKLEKAVFMNGGKE